MSERFGRWMLVVIAATLLPGCPPESSNPDAAAGGPVDAAGSGGAGGTSGVGGGGAGGTSGVGGGGAGGSGGVPDGGVAATALETVRTYAFHDVTALTAHFANWPALSGDGKVIAFSTTTATPSRIVVNAINADGSNQRVLDSFEPLCHCDGRLDISADGQSVVVTDAVQIRIAKGTTATPLVKLSSNEIWDIRITADGGRVFFLLRRDAANVATGTPMERGVWVVNADGSGLRQVTSATAVGTLVGMTADKVFPFAGCGTSMDVSADGSRIAFASAVAGMESVFAVNADGGGLKKLVDASAGHKLVGKIGLSGNGQLVGFHAYVGDNLLELGVIGFDGSGRRKLSNEPPAPLAGCQGKLELTEDAKKLFVAEPGYLYETDGSGVLQLTTVAFRPPNGAALQDGTTNGTMNATGTRFAMRRLDTAGIGQVMLLELDPPALGAAPTLMAPTFAPARVSIAGLGMASATVRAAGMGLIQVGVVFYSDGLPDIIDRGGGTALFDNGMNADPAANDGVFSGRGYAGFNMPKAGPKNLRFTAENKVGSLRHATVLETKGVVVE